MEVRRKDPLGLPAPSTLERLLAAVAPRMALQRYQARAAFAFLGSAGGYVGARTDRRATKEWTPRATGADADQLPDATTLRARSRDLIRNAGIATGTVNTTVRNTIGSGLRPHPQIDRDLLGLSEEAADAWERQAQRLWAIAADTTMLDITDRLSFAQQCDLVCRSEFESGDVFAVRRFVERPGQLFGLKIQLLEADRVCNPDYLPDTTRLAGGVEIDADGAPIRYHVSNRHPDDLLMAAPITWTALPVRGAATGERQVLHVFRPLRPDQTRGIPMLGPVIEPLKQLDRYSEAELMAAVIASLFTVFVKSEEEDTPTGLADTAGTTTAVANELKLGAGAIVDLAKGESIEIADPKRPNDKFDPFFIACVRQIAVATELPVEVVLLQFTSSYSASRAAIQEAWRSFLTRRSRLAGQFCQPVYEWVIAEAVARGYLQAPGFFDSPLLRAAWTAAEWRGPTPSSLSPVDDATAAEKFIAMGVKTVQEVTAETTGGDWERNHQQRVKEVRMRRRDGIDVEPVAERIVTSPQTPVAPPTAGPAAEPGRSPAQEAA